jgi:hypothetical protein
MEVLEKQSIRLAIILLLDTISFPSQGTVCIHAHYNIGIAEEGRALGLWMSTFLSCCTIYSS